MNKKQFSKIISLYTSGVDSEACTVMILSLHEVGDHRSAAKWIESLYSHIHEPVPSYRDERTKQDIAIAALVDLGWLESSARELLFGE